MKSIEVKTVSRLRAILLALAAIGICAVFFREALLALRLLLGATIAAFLIDPLATKLEKRVRRSRAVALAFLIALGCVALSLLILFPPLVGQFRELGALVPEIASRINAQIGRLNAFLEKRGLNGFTLSGVDWQGLLGNVGVVWSGTARIFGSVANAFTQLALSVLLSYYFLADKKNTVLRLEMLVPVRWRLSAAKMGAAVKDEMLSYARGQALVSLCVASLTALLLAIIGVRGWLALGVIVGVTNLIPYFGPVIGGVPTVLCALTGGLLQAGLSAAALFAVQQIDGMLLTPRITGGTTGLAPPGVMMSVLLGGSAFGAAGMLLAVPAVVTVRAIVRVWIAERGEMETR